ncbi:MAG: hypothetical protein RR553_08310 [Akkermansia sp.]
MNTGIRVIGDGVTPDLKRLQGLVKPGSGLSVALGRALRNELVKHFRAKNQKPNKLGGKKTNFWAGIASSVSSAQCASKKISCKITSPHVAIHIYGGTITPKKAKILTIPIVPEAHGRSPKTFGNGKKGGLQWRPWGLAMGETTYYVFKKSVQIPKDNTALPKDSDVINSLNRAAKIVMRENK